MRITRLNFGKTVRIDTQTTEHLDVTIEIGPQEYEEEAIAKARTFVEKNLATNLRATIGQRISADGRPPALPPSGPGTNGGGMR